MKPKLTLLDLFWLMLVVALAGMCGCNQAPIPTLRPIAKISAQIHAVPDLGITAIDCVEIPEEDLSEFAMLITPTERCLQEIDSSMHYRVADVTVHHTDGTKTALIVRWTGANPAAISLDDHNFYYGGIGAFADGAIRISHLLHKYKYESSIRDQLPNP